MNHHAEHNKGEGVSLGNLPHEEPQLHPNNFTHLSELQHLVPVPLLKVVLVDCVVHFLSPKLVVCSGPAHNGAASRTVNEFVVCLFAPRVDSLD